MKCLVMHQNNNIFQIDILMPDCYFSEKWQIGNILVTCIEKWEVIDW